MVAWACSPSYLGGWGGRIAWTQEAEVAVSHDCATALHPGDRARLRLKKKKKLLSMVTCVCSLSYSGGWGRRIAWPWEAEVAVSLGHATAFQPGAWWRSETLSQKKKEEYALSQSPEYRVLITVSFISCSHSLAWHLLYIQKHKCKLQYQTWIICWRWDRMNFENTVSFHDKPELKS